ncbi:MAG: tetratricopeptide repeat protein, partial [Burkholderiales bacterium]
ASFGAALSRDAGCAMAAWGDAMAYEHPLWSQRDVAKSRAALARISREDRLTPKERAYIAAARALFSTADRSAAHKAWLAAAAKMHRDMPGDDEIALQHALALIAVYDELPGHQRELSRAGAIALDVMRRRPGHPGAAHYVIHAFDNPEHAILALPAAQSYARIAPAAAHALHMPSHTFAQLGMWADIVPSNVRAFAASQDAAKGLGQSPEKWDWHAYSWLVAAHLELGQARQAKKLMEDARALLATDDSAYLRLGYVDIVMNYLAQTGRWAEAESLTAPLLAPIRGEGTEGSGSVACAEHAPGGTGEERPPFVLLARMLAYRMRAEASLRTGNAASAEAQAKEMSVVVEQMRPWGEPRPIRLAQIAEIEARARLVGSRTPEAEKQALLAIEKVVQLTNSAQLNPLFFLTARERLGEALLAAGRPADALVEYERVLDESPNRALSLLGAARSAHAVGDTAKARAYYETLAKLWKNADPDLPALGDVRAGGRERSG